ncbi:prepilin-type N-terminal cleavage/methylation domain-containing protein [Tatumella ptyseos]|uniref:prepilin-type N-terminal cleavage/methylation domain-containing protein n=1 Tax=Tatumella ptyseos TaxID=82987 RepID=UPI0026EA14D0|nr:prepilin-type N-terminal cleavage/methylation domain-containing protein [Tatumella ptyseos]WKX27229.1 prepilin-type N-terminal cleavage/methylation domain-containing protein [Tatumella ptyseos]
MRLYSRMSTAGFTLLEILIVLVITAVLTGLGSQSLNQWQSRQQVKASAKELTYFLDRLRQQANAYHLTIKFRHSLQNEETEISAVSERWTGRNKKWTWKPNTPKVKLLAVVGEPRFFGKHGTAWPGSFEIGNQATRWRVIISTHGRVRYCESHIKGCQ